MNRLNVLVAGSTGYIGVQLVKLLCKHRYIKIKYLCGNTSIGKKIHFYDKELKKYDLPIYINKFEASFWKKKYDNLIITGSNDTFSLGKSSVSTIHTPGHTPGSCCYLFDKNLIAGDTLFVFGCGRCDLHGGNPEEMYNSLKNLKNNLDQNTIIMPGHNYSIKRQSTIGEEITGNPFFSFDNLKDFVQYRMHDHDKTRQEPYAPITRR